MGVKKKTCLKCPVVNNQEPFRTENCGFLQPLHLCNLARPGRHPKGKRTKTKLCCEEAPPRTLRPRMLYEVSAFSFLKKWMRKLGFRDLRRFAQGHCHALHIPALVGFLPLLEGCPQSTRPLCPQGAPKQGCHFITHPLPL